MSFRKNSTTGNKNIFWDYADQIFILHHLRNNNSVVLNCDSPLSANSFKEIRTCLENFDVTLERGNKIVVEIPIFFFNLKNKSTNQYCFISIYNEEELLLLSGKEDIVFASANDAKDYIKQLDTIIPITEEKAYFIKIAQERARQQIESLNKETKSRAGGFRKQIKQEGQKEFETTGIDNNASWFNKRFNDGGVASLSIERIYSREYIDKLINYMKEKYGYKIPIAMYNIIERKTGKLKLYGTTKERDLITLASDFGYDFASAEDAEAFIKNIERIPLDKYHPECDKYNRAKSIKTAERNIAEFKDANRQGER